MVCIPSTIVESFGANSEVSLIAICDQGLFISWACRYKTGRLCMKTDAGWQIDICYCSASSCQIGHEGKKKIPLPCSRVLIVGGCRHFWLLTQKHPHHGPCIEEPQAFAVLQEQSESAVQRSLRPSRV